MNEYQREKLNELMAIAYEDSRSKMLSENALVQKRGYEKFGYYNGIEEALLTLGFSITHDKETGAPRIA